MGKVDFLEELEEIVEDSLYIGDSVDDLDKETSQNMWSISMGQELANEFNLEDLLTLFTRVQINRKVQITKSSNHHMIFYAWFERQSGRLRFNLISDCHSNLPFGCEYTTINNIEPILNEFLDFPYHDGFPIVEIEEKTEEVSEDETKPTPLIVYKSLVTND